MCVEIMKTEVRELNVDMDIIEFETLVGLLDTQGKEKGPCFQKT